MKRLFEGCTVVPETVGPCEGHDCRFNKRYILGGTHIVREYVERRYGLVSEPHLYCAKHCPVCNAEKPVVVRMPEVVAA